MIKSIQPLCLVFLVSFACCKTMGGRSQLQSSPVVTTESEAAAVSDCSSRWDVFSQKPYEQIALPDTNVRYWRFRFKQKAAAPVNLRLSGTFPKARYMNFNIYDAKTMNSSASLPDIKIQADPGSSNPFQPNAEGEAEARNYTVWVKPGADTDNNTVPTPSNAASEDKSLELWYRVYSPTHEISAAELPRIEAFTDGSGSTPVACPTAAALEPAVSADLDALPPENPLGTIWFYRARATGLYANLDNIYLGTRVRVIGGNVAIFKFRAPKIREEVRYWSICVGGIDQRTSGCLRDEEMKIDGAGFVTVVVGPESVKSAAVNRGQNWLPWGTQSLQVLVYRNLLSNPEFAGDLHKVKKVESGALFQASQYAAQNYIGDYAPVGRKCIRLAYMANNCGL